MHDRGGVLGGPPENPGQSYYALGPQEPPGSFPLLGRIDVGAGRLRSAEQTAGDDAPGAVIYPVGAEVAFDVFGEISRRTD